MTTTVVAVESRLNVVSTDQEVSWVQVGIQGPAGPAGAGGGDHGALTGLADDDHTQYPLGAGRAGGQTLRGGTAAGETLTLQSTAHATRGKLLFGSSAYDEVGNLLGVGVTSPTAALHLKSGSASAGTAPLKLQDGPLLTTPEAGAIEQQAGVLYHTDANSVRRNLATESFVEAKAANLLTNGAGELLNNRNWSAYTFDAIDTYASPGSFRINVAQTIRRSDDLIPVDTTQRLRQSLWAKSGDISGANYNAANRQYFATNFYDSDGLEIDSAHAEKISSSVETTLALALNPGDLTITLTDATGWYNSTSSASRGFVWFGWANSKGYVYPDYTYSRNRLSNAWPSGGIAGNVITLNAPWAGPALSAGAAVRNSGSGATFRYNIANNVILSNSWTRYEGSISGFGYATSNYRFGTAYVKFGHLVNYHGAADNNVRLANVRFNNLSSANLEPQIGVGATYKDLAQTALPANGLAVEGRVGVGTSIPSAAVHVVSTTEQVRFGYDANDYLALTVASDGKVAVDLVGSAGGCRLAYSDATSNAVYDLLTLSKNRNTGAGAVGLGVRLILAAKSSTTNDTPQGAVESTWVTATHASRKARVKFSAYDSTGAREVIRIEANGAAPLLGFYGVAAVAMPAALTAQSTSITHTAPGTPDYAIQALSSGGYGFATQDEGHTLLSVVANLQTRVGELETKLRSLGLLT